ncbi:hypothetical protein PAPYR_12006 [Paratrimastix pyriformis]|uniref:Uncharacterized protein n=1 Tax=Paratrimastix pyriformis TaxID=342808 RepID=A0ABQ8U2M7_9EUKA|nr:hypothetical protein PAPYR_12006 [Paratrimastix pyriformis]
MPRHPPHPSPSRLPPRLPTPSPHLSLRFFLFPQSPPLHLTFRYPHRQQPIPSAIQPTSSLYQPSPLQTLDSIDSRVNSYPFLPYFIHQRFSPNHLHHLIPYPAHLH